MQNNIEKELEKIYIIQPITKENAEKYRVLHDEAVALIESAGALYAGTIYQKIREINPATFVGEGKLCELNELLYGLDEITVLFNGELTPSQTINISSALNDRKVIDRTTLILDIFAKNAKSGEGKLQVELAQLKYLYPRLKGKGASLSRLGGGVGTRGPGETQLETDRRYIRVRLNYLENKLKEIEKRREQLVERRKKQEVKTIALVGYTNVGKSTLMNLLTNSEVYVKNELFATLDPTSRSFKINGIEFMLIDTVGFLQDLPHDLIQAFHSTLESALNADLALIVCDGQGEYDMQIETTVKTLEKLGFSSNSLIVVNKTEEIVDKSLWPYNSVCISAKENIGIDELKKKIFEFFEKDFLFCEIFVPYPEMSNYSKYKECIVEQNSRFENDGLFVDAIIPMLYLGKFEKYIIAKK